MTLPNTAPEWWAGISQLVTAAAMLAVLTPNSFDNKLLKFLREVLDLFALNFWNAKNAKK